MGALLSLSLSLSSQQSNVARDRRRRRRLLLRAQQQLAVLAAELATSLSLSLSPTEHLSHPSLLHPCVCSHCVCACAFSFRLPEQQRAPRSARSRLSLSLSPAAAAANNGRPSEPRSLVAPLHPPAESKQASSRSSRCRGDDDDDGDVSTPADSSPSIAFFSFSAATGRATDGRTVAGKKTTTAKPPGSYSSHLHTLGGAFAGEGSSGAPIIISIARGYLLRPHKTCVFGPAAREISNTHR